MDSNGYNDSLFYTEQGKCFVCYAEGDTARHEIFGASLRQWSKKEGLWVNLCPRCHEVAHKGGALTHQLKVAGQREYLSHHHSYADFFNAVGKFYDY